MSNYHILDGLLDGNKYRVALHIAIPSANNAAGVNWRTAIIEFRRLPDGTQPKSTVPFITPQEQTQLDNGELVEEVITFDTHPGVALAAKRDQLDALYNAERGRIQAEWQERLRYWGFSRNVP